MVTGGASPGRRGAAFERAVVKDQLAAGRAAYRLRQGGGCAVDVIATERCEDGGCSLGNSLHHVYYLQVKVGGYLLPAERAALLERAQADGSVPVLALRVNGGVHYKRLTDSDASDDLRDAARDARER